MKRRLTMALAASALTIGILPGMAAAAGPSVAIKGDCEGVSLNQQGGSELIRSFRASLRSGAYDDCTSGSVTLYINGKYIYGVFFGMG